MRRAVLAPIAVLAVAGAGCDRASVVELLASLGQGSQSPDPDPARVASSISINLPAGGHLFFMRASERSLAASPGIAAFSTRVEPNMTRVSVPRALGAVAIFRVLPQAQCTWSTGQCQRLAQPAAIPIVPYPDIRALPRDSTREVALPAEAGGTEYLFVREREEFRQSGGVPAVLPRGGPTTTALLLSTGAEARLQKAMMTAGNFTYATLVPHRQLGDPNEPGGPPRPGDSDIPSQPGCCLDPLPGPRDSPELFLLRVFVDARKAAAKPRLFEPRSGYPRQFLVPTLPGAADVPPLPLPAEEELVDSTPAPVPVPAPRPL